MADSHVRGVQKMTLTVSMAHNNSNQVGELCRTLSFPHILANKQISRNQGKSDKILETVLRMDGLLRSIHDNLVRRGWN